MFFVFEDSVGDLANGSGDGIAGIALIVDNAISGFFGIFVRFCRKFFGEIFETTERFTKDVGGRVNWERGVAVFTKDVSIDATRMDSYSLRDVKLESSGVEQGTRTEDATFRESGELNGFVGKDIYWIGNDKKDGFWRLFGKFGDKLFEDGAIGVDEVEASFPFFLTSTGGDNYELGVTAFFQVFGCRNLGIGSEG